MKKLKQKHSILIKHSNIRIFKFAFRKIEVRVKRSILDEGTHQIGTKRSDLNLSYPDLNKVFLARRKGKSKGNEKLVQLSESST